MRKRSVFESSKVDAEGTKKKHKTKGGDGVWIKQGLSQKGEKKFEFVMKISGGGKIETLLGSKEK